MIQTERIYEELKQVLVIDTHEHLWSENHRIQNPGDWTALFRHYMESSFASAGMTAEESQALYGSESHEQKWDVFSKYLPLVSNTAYAKAAKVAVRDIYGIAEITSDSMRDLDSRIRESVKPGFYRKVIHDMAGIDFCMIDCFDTDAGGCRQITRFDQDNELMRSDMRGDTFIYPGDFENVERETGIDTGHLDGWLQAIDIYFERNADKCCGIKIALAYLGDLDFDLEISRENVEAAYDSHRKSRDNYIDARPLISYLLHYLVDKAADYRLPLKFHTGIYAGANHVDFDAISTNVKHISQLALAYPRCDFIAMHISYPYDNELVMAVKQITNLYADMCWAWIVDTYAASEFLKKALTAAPVCKIMGFGGDYSLPENTYGHLIIARRAISAALAELVNLGYFTLQEAFDAGHWLLRKSAQRVYSC